MISPDRPRTIVPVKLGFAEAWESRVTVSLEVPDGSVPLHFLGIEDLIRNKEAAGRPKDPDDLAYLKSRH
jgi:hypothetical protein